MRWLRKCASPTRYGPAAAAGKLAAALLVALAAGLPARAEVTVAALGDSLIAGYGLAQEDGFVPRMQTWLAEHGVAATLVNAGVSGDTSAGGRSRVDWTLTPEVDAMILLLGGNDLLRGIDPAVTRRNLGAILKAARAKELPVLLIGLRAPGNYGPDYRKRFDAIYGDLARKFDTLYARNFFAALQAKEDSAAARRKYLQADGIHPSAAGVAEIVAALGPKVRALVTRAKAQAPAD